MTLGTSLLEAQANAVTTVVAYVSIHRSADSPAVDVEPIVWAYPATNATDIEFDVPKGVYGYVGYWDATMAQVGGRELDKPARFSRKGTFTIPAGGLVEVVL